MAIEERLERIEHLSAGSEEQRRKDREMDRALWRETQRQLNDLATRIAEVNQNLSARIAQLAEESAGRDRETDRRFHETDARIDKMISAMGGYIRDHPQRMTGTQPCLVIGLPILKISPQGYAAAVSKTQMSRRLR